MNMKYIASAGALMAALCLVNTGMAQDALQPRPGAPAVPAMPVPPQAPEDPAADYNKAQAEYADAQDQYKQAAASFDQNLAVLRSVDNNVYALNNFGPGGRGDSPLIIRSSDSDAKTLAAEQEDLTIMGRILEKSLAGRGEDERPEAMGIKLITVGVSGGVRSMQIEGYGAIFMLNVNFPLVGPANKADEGENKEPANSTWDEAKREVYGQPGGADGNPFGARFSKEEFDPKRVEKLKDSLLDTLKNASNMRNVKPDESVTVVVRSGAGRMGGPLRVRVGTMGGGSSGFTWNVGAVRLNGDKSAGASGAADAGGLGGGGGFGRSSGGGGGQPPPAGAWVPNPAGGMKMVTVADSVESVLTIRAKKSDIDAFAKGKSTPDDFRKRATVLIY